MKVILICGPSCSGKSTITKELAKHLDSEIISIDTFYIIDGDKYYVTHEGEEVRTFERKESYDGEKVARILRELQNQKKVKYEAIDFEQDKVREYTITQKKFILVEGFHALNYPGLLELADETIYLDLHFSDQLQRRQARGGRPKSDETFIKIGEQEYLEHILPQQEKAELVLDARKPVTELVERILSHLQQVL